MGIICDLIKEHIWRIRRMNRRRRKWHEFVFCAFDRRISFDEEIAAGTLSFCYPGKRLPTLRSCYLHAHRLSYARQPATRMFLTYRTIIIQNFDAGFPWCIMLKLLSNLSPDVRNKFSTPIRNVVRTTSTCGCVLMCHVVSVTAVSIRNL